MEKEMLCVDDEGNELILPKTEQIPSDFYRKGEAVRAWWPAWTIRTTIPRLS